MSESFADTLKHYRERFNYGVNGLFDELEKNCPPAAIGEDALMHAMLIHLLMHQNIDNSFFSMMESLSRLAKEKTEKSEGVLNG